MNHDIEVYQGRDDAGRPFGYDHARRNYITWGRSDDGMHAVPMAVEHDSEVQAHGSLSATTRDAIHCGRRVTWGSPLGRAIGLTY